MSSLNLTPVTAATVSVVPAEVAAAAYALKTDVPTNSELVAGAFYGPSSITSTTSMPVFVAPFACEVVQAYLVCHQGSVSASDTNYWTIKVRRVRSGTAVDVASKTTQATGGEAITAKVAWSFDAVTFDSSNRVLQAGDVVDIGFFETGTADGLNNPFAQIRYEPV